MMHYSITAVCRNLPSVGTKHVLNTFSYTAIHYLQGFLTTHPRQVSLWSRDRFGTFG